MKAKSARQRNRPNNKTQPEWADRSAWPYVSVAAASLWLLFEVYGNALHGPFIYDDFSLPFYRPGFPVEMFTAWITGVRPLLMLSYWFNYHWFGQDPYSYHALNLVFHAANSTLVFLILRRILAPYQIDLSPVDVLSAFGGALFLLHPLQTESVAYIAGRSEVLSAFFFLSAFAIFLYRPSWAISWPRSILVLALFGCAVATKEHTVTLPIVLLLADVYDNSENRIAAIGRNWRLYLPMLCCGLVASAVIGLEVISRSPSAGFAGTGVSWATYALTECQVFFVYLRLLLVPAGLNFDHDIPWANSILDLSVSSSLVSIVMLSTLAWCLRKRFPAGCFGLLVLIVLLAPTSSFIPIKDPIAEHRLYLPMLGFVLIPCDCLLHLDLKRGQLLRIATGIIVVVSIATYCRSRVWASESALWKDTIAKSPNKIRDYGHLVHGLVREHRCREALNILEDVSRRLRPDAALLSHWSFAYECVGDPEEALEKLQQSAALLPWPSTYVNMARHQLTLNRLQDSIESLTRALMLNPKLEFVYVMRAGLFEREGDLLAAAKDYERALHLNPQNQQAYWHLRQISAIQQLQHGSSSN